MSRRRGVTRQTRKEEERPSSEIVGAVAHPSIKQMISLAANDVNRLSVSRSYRSSCKSWTDFLEHANRAINRLEGYARKTNQLDKYKRLVTQEIWAEPLTSYVRAARNAHEHGIEPTSAKDPHDERFLFPNGMITGSPRVIAMTERGEMTIAPKAGKAELYASPGIQRIAVNSSIRLTTVDNKKGVHIEPPFVAIDHPSEPVAAAVARLYLAWLYERVKSFV